MLILFRVLACALVVFVATATPGSAEYRGVSYHWTDKVSEDASTWADYFRQNARIVLGPERRLPNGVSWRLQTDDATGIAFPRLTWMPDRQRLLVANRLLDKAQGGELLVERSLHDVLARENEVVVALKEAPHPPRPMLDQWDVDLTYVGARLMSMRTSAMENVAASRPTAFLRGLTFDLQAETIIELSPCSRRATYSGPFRYGSLLDLCDEGRYRAFIALMQQIDARSGHPHLTFEESLKTQGCVGNAEKAVFRDDQEYVLYLTFAGLAVQAAGSDCPVMATPDNPVIVPYRELTPFMPAGAPRDELLALPTR